MADPEGNEFCVEMSRAELVRWPRTFTGSVMQL
jgi:hypothetical protein